MSIWKTLFSSGDTIEKVTDAVISTGDKLFFTDEEKADMSLKVRTQFITLLKGYEPFKISQRILVIFFSFMFGSAFMTGLGVTIFNMIITYRATLKGIAKEDIVIMSTEPLFALMSAFNLGLIMLAIASFYFAGGSIESFRKKN